MRRKSRTSSCVRRNRGFRRRIDPGMSVHQEIPIKLTAWIDQGVVPLVEALDGFQGAYVLFRLRGTSDQATGFASGLAADLNSEEGVSYLLQAEWRPGESE